MAKTKVAEVEEVEERKTIEKEAETLGVKTSRVLLAGFKDKNKADKMQAEQVRQDKKMAKRLKNRVEAAKIKAGMKPIDTKRALLIGRLKAVKSQVRANTYTDANIKAWLEELDMIDQNPKSWNKLTVNGTKPFTPGNKKKRTTQDILNGMDLD